MAVLKPIKPSLKEKKRYVVFDVISDSKINADELVNCINKRCFEFMGILHFAKAGVLILKNQFSDHKGMLRVNHKYVDHIKAALMMITKINNKKVNIRAIGVSGILKKAREKFVLEKSG